MEKPCKSATMGILIPQTDICSRYNDWRVEDRPNWNIWRAVDDMALQWFLLSWLVRHTYIVQFSYRGGFFDDCWWMDGRWLKGGGDGEEEIPKSRVCLFVLVPTARIATLPYTYSMFGSFTNFVVWKWKTKAGHGQYRCSCAEFLQTATDRGGCDEGADIEISSKKWNLIPRGAEYRALIANKESKL